MARERIKAGILGIGGCGTDLLDALLACDSIELVALADRDRERAKDRAAELKIEPYDDYRSLVVEQPIDALFVAVPPFACHEHLKLAASRGIHVWRETPLARSLHEAVDLVRAFDVGGVRLAVARRWQFDLQASGVDNWEELTGPIYVARGVALESRPDPLGWRGESDRGGGGALIDRAYELIHAVVQKMHLPDEVQVATARRSGTQPYDTEDVACMTLRYQNGSMATMLAHRRTWPTTWSLVFDGPTGSLRLDADGLTVLAADGTKILSRCLDDRSVYGRQVDGFAQAILTEAKTYPSPALEHLPTVAVIETAYLSARTGEPESPAQLYDLHDLPLPFPTPVEEEEESAEMSE